MIIAIVPAQSKSSRLPGKNMREILGKPMMDYTIEYAQNCPLIDETYVSTDSEEIALHARTKGAKAVIRPDELCGNVAIVDVLKHCVNQIPHRDKITHVVALQVDHPDRTLELEPILKKVVEKDIADFLTLEEDGVRNGSVRIVRKMDLMEGRLSYSVMALRDKCTNIHYQEDFEKAARNIAARIKKNG